MEANQVSTLIIDVDQIGRALSELEAGWWVATRAEAPRS